MSSLSADPGSVRDQITIVDVDLKYLPPYIRNHPNLTVLTARFDSAKGRDHSTRANKAYKLLKFYRNRAKVLITSRIHAALPAIGHFQTYDNGNLDIKA